MPSERKTENIIRNLLKKRKYTFENGFGNKGYPEFIIYKINNDDLIIIIECKLNIEHHISKGNTFKPQDYAVDGVLHYANFLSKEYNVIAIAASGHSTKEMCIDGFFIKKHSIKPIVISTGTIYTYEKYLNEIKNN